MVKNHGAFIAAKLMNKKLEMFISLDNEWLAYADGDVQSYTLIIGTPINYHEASGVITFKNDAGQTFYIGEEFIEAFWTIDSGFKLLENTTSTIRSGKQWLQNKKGKKRDFM